MHLSNEIKIVGFVVAGLLTARFVILALDAIAETIERRTLYR
jgi:hypothetical protein